MTNDKCLMTNDEMKRLSHIGNDGRAQMVDVTGVGAGMTND